MELLNITKTSNIDTLEIGINGSLTQVEAVNLKRELMPETNNFQKIIIEMSKMDEIDITGLNTLLMLKHSMDNKNKKFILKNAKKSDDLKRLLHLTKFQEAFIFEN